MFTFRERPVSQSKVGVVVVVVSSSTLAAEFGEVTTEGKFAAAVTADLFRVYARVDSH